MEQVIGLIIMLVIWSIISVIRNNAKKQQALMQKKAEEQSQSGPTTRPGSTMDELSKLIEMFSGQEPVSQTYTPQTVTQAEVESIETMVEEGGIEAAPQSYSSIDSYSPITASFEDNNPEANLRPMINISTTDENIFAKKKNVVHPVLSDFDPKKAVIYSAILEPKYF